MKTGKIDFDAMRAEYADVIQDVGKEVYDEAVEHVKSIGVADELTAKLCLLAFIAGYGQGRFETLFHDQ